MAEAFHEKLHLIRSKEKVEVRFATLSLEEATAVAEAISANPLLKELDLEASKIGPLRRLEPYLQPREGGGLPQLEALAGGLRGSSVTDLGLRDTYLGDEGVRALALVLRETSIKGLRLDLNGIEVVGAQALAAGLRFSSVTSLFLYHNHLGDEGAKAVAAALSETSIRHLGLGNNQIRVDGVRALVEGVKSSSVSHLNLCLNPVGDEAVKLLTFAETESRLEILGLDQTRIGDAGVRVLAASLRDSSVTELDLSGNYFREEGAQALLEGLRGSPVQLIQLNRVDCSQETVKQIRAAAQANRRAAKARSFVLQMDMQRSENEVTLKFRTLAGSEVAVLTWNLDRPVQELPKAVLTAMRSSGLPLPLRGMSATNLRLVRPEGAILDVTPAAASLALQLGIDVEPRDATGMSSS